jgi:hypothetical protein
MSKILVALVLCAGCGTRDGLDSDGGPDAGLEVSALADTKDADSHKQKLYTYVLPKDMQPTTVSGLEVVLKAESASPPEGYFIDVFAVKPAKDQKEKPQRLELGTQAVFKPLKKGESTTVYLDPPSKEAWLQGRTGEELRLGFQIKPGNPDRKTPDVKLRIVDVKLAPPQ